MITFITAIHISTVVILVITVLLQSGKGAEISASFGGSSQTVFGSSGGANFFQKLTYTLAAIFMVTSLTLTILPSRIKRSVFEGFTPPPATTIPVTPGAAPATGVPATTNATKTETATDTKTSAPPAAASNPNTSAPGSAPTNGNTQSSDQKK